MPFTSKFLPEAKLGRGLLVLAAFGLLVGAGLVFGGGLLLGPARAQNIDEGKSAQQLFAGSCVTCHRSPNNLARGRITPTLFLFLQDHYTTSKTEAWRLSSYLASVDTTGRSRAGSQPSKKRRAPVRPPASVPN
jgi:cytochrome c553